MWNFVMKVAYCRTYIINELNELPETYSIICPGDFPDDAIIFIQTTTKSCMEFALKLLKERQYIPSVSRYMSIAWSMPGPIDLTPPNLSIAPPPNDKIDKWLILWFLYEEDYYSFKQSIKEYGYNISRGETKNAVLITHSSKQRFYIFEDYLSGYIKIWPQNIKYEFISFNEALIYVLYQISKHMVEHSKV